VDGPGGEKRGGGPTVRLGDWDSGLPKALELDGYIERYICMYICMYVHTMYGFWLIFIGPRPRKLDEQREVVRHLQHAGRGWKGWKPYHAMPCEGQQG